MQASVTQWESVLFINPLSKQYEIPHVPHDGAISAASITPHAPEVSTVGFLDPHDTASKAHDAIFKAHHSASQEDMSFFALHSLDVLAAFQYS